MSFQFAFPCLLLSTKQQDFTVHTSTMSFFLPPTPVTLSSIASVYALAHGITTAFYHWPNPVLSSHLTLCYSTRRGSWGCHASSLLLCSDVDLTVSWGKLEMGPCLTQHTSVPPNISLVAGSCSLKKTGRVGKALSRSLRREKVVGSCKSKL